MPTAKLGLSLAVPVSKSPPATDPRERWRVAYRMARRMIRSRRSHSLAAAHGWFLGHAGRRFGSYPGCRAAAGLVGRLAAAA